MGSGDSSRRLAPAAMCGSRSLRFLALAAISLAFASRTLAATPGDLAYEAGRAALDAKDDDLAIAQFERAIELDPTRADAYYSLGLLYRKRDRWREALDAFDHAVASPSAPAEAHCQLGEIRMEVFAQAPEALGHLLRAVEVDPDYARAHRLLGLAYLQLNDLAAAIEALDHADRLDATNAETAYGLGLAHTRLGALVAARARFVDAIERDRRHAKSHLALGNCLMRLGEVEDGREALDAFRRLTVEAEQIAHLERATRRDPSNVAAWAELGRIRLRRDEWPAAVEALERQVALDADDTKARERLGFAYFRLERYADAAEAYATVVTREPDIAAYRNSLAGAYLMLRDAPRAIEQFQVAIRLAPNDARLRLNLAKAYEQAGRPDEAAAARAAYDELQADGE